jgi:tetratricopeptide (TPR) repeat protein
VLYNWANLLLRQGRFDQAISLYRRAEDEWADHALLHNNLGVALMQSARTAPPREQSARLQAAYEQFDRAAHLDPNYADAQLHLAIMLAMKGDYDAASARYRRALEINPDLTAARQGLATVERLMQSGRPH